MNNDFAFDTAEMRFVVLYCIATDWRGLTTTGASVYAGKVYTGVFKGLFSTHV